MSTTTSITPLSKVRPNDVCWCNEGRSQGKKFKKCCLPLIRAHRPPKAGFQKPK